ncbi:MAG: tripartite tricarboxylate transporter substrate binding protein [Betaproteobacteria bacterium]|nr:tripartite tricarboxylate transporter substrate binding protein [Betaproteobacteria bacterium]MBI2288901.1 tripartite tricarboxylate transporter substrate binding protein [Betaproteobacteria bacterium]MBI3054263.1 tripartite tricarboxylate transporter substrate binding protein [Betaproteobacteria bacterium]
MGCAVSRKTCLLLALSWAALPAAQAQVYPNKPIRLIVPASIGSVTDVVARALAQKLTERWAQPVVVEDRRGANGVLGSEFVAKSAPDGYTLLVVDTAHVTNPARHAKLPYDTLHDFAPVSMIALVPSVLVVHPSLPARTVKELVALAGARLDGLNYASAGSGSATHMAGLLFNMMAGVSMVRVPYKGGRLALTELIGGQVSLMFGSMILSMPHVRTGKLRALGVTSAQRSAAEPGLPTIAEAALPGYEVTTWFALLAPAKTPGPIVNKLNSEITSLLTLPDIRERMLFHGAEVHHRSSADLGDHIRREIAKWDKLIKESAARMDPP